MGGHEHAALISGRYQLYLWGGVYPDEPERARQRGALLAEALRASRTALDGAFRDATEGLGLNVLPFAPQGRALGAPRSQVLSVQRWVADTGFRITLTVWVPDKPPYMRLERAADAVGLALRDAPAFAALLV